jgi:hypothetical protein
VRSDLVLLIFAASLFVLSFISGYMERDRVTDGKISFDVGCLLMSVVLLAFGVTSISLIVLIARLGLMQP